VLSGDTATSESAVRHALEQLRQTEAYEPELVMLVQCTSPLTLSADFDGLIDTLMRERADSAFTVCPFHHFLWKRGGDGASEGVNHEGARRKRRQELEPQFLETGAAYVMRTEAFLASDERFCGRTVMYSTPPEVPSSPPCLAHLPPSSSTSTECSPTTGCGSIRMAAKP
jgi:N-acylneuraminate cytidylyltransferase